MTPEKYILTDEQIDKSWFGSWGGDPDKQDIIRSSLLQWTGGYVTGWTITQICKNLKLLTPKSTRNKPKLSKYGKSVMYWLNAEKVKNLEKEITALHAANKGKDQEIERLEGLVDHLKEANDKLQEKVQNGYAGTGCID